MGPPGPSQAVPAVKQGDRVRTEYGLCTGPAHLPALKVKDGHLQEPGTVPQGTMQGNPDPLEFTL